MIEWFYTVLLFTLAWIFIQAVVLSFTTYAPEGSASQPRP